MKINRLIRWWFHNNMEQQRTSIRNPIRDIPVGKMELLTEESYQELISLGNFMDYNKYIPKWETPKSLLLEELDIVNKYNFFGILDNKKFKLEEQILQEI
jgi:hypothetical protein